MNDVQNLLKDLKDIHYPAPISWWPPAPGWYILAVVILIMALLVIGLAFVLWRRHVRLKAIKQDYEKLFTQYQTNPKDSKVLSELSIWMKRLLLAYFPRDEVASLTGENWLIFLDKVSKTHNFTQGAGRILLTGPYAPVAPPQTQDLFMEIAHLMNKLSKQKFRRL